MTASEERDDLAVVFRDAGSPLWSVRADAGRRLAAYAEHDDVAPVLHDLLLDDRDTGVVRDTARALLRRDDVLGLRLVLAALAEASDAAVPDWDPSAMDELGTAVSCDPRWMDESGEAHIVEQLHELALDADESVREEAKAYLCRVDPSPAP